MLLFGSVISGLGREFQCERQTFEKYKAKVKILQGAFFPSKALARLDMIPSRRLLSQGGLPSKVTLLL